MDKIGTHGGITSVGTLERERKEKGAEGCATRGKDADTMQNSCDPYSSRHKSGCYSDHGLGPIVSLN